MAKSSDEIMVQREKEMMSVMISKLKVLHCDSVLKILEKGTIG